MADRPKRRWTVDIHASADEWPQAISTLRELADHLEEHGPTCDLVQGGYSGSGYIRVAEDPSMTHEKYGQALDAYLASLRQSATKR